MGWNGSGTFNRTDGTRSGTQVWQDARDAGVKIRADDHDTHDQDIADGLENTVALDGQNTTTTDNAILRYDSGNSQFEGVTISASEIVGRSATGDIRGLSAATARQTIGVGTAASTNNSLLQYSSADGKYVGTTTISGDPTFSGTPTLNHYLVDPEHATDSGTDTYDSATNTTPPANGVTITRDFQSANTTTTPTLDGKTMTTKDGSALWAGAVSGVHDVQYDSGADTYLVLNPIPDIPVSTDLLDEDDMSSDSDTAVPTQQSVKAYADTKARIATGTYTGDGQATQSITGLGFQPKWLWINRRETSDASVNNQHFTSDVIIDDTSNGAGVQGLGNGNGWTVEDDLIASLDSDGFTVGDGGSGSNPNTNSQAYNYVAIG